MKLPVLILLAVLCLLAACGRRGPPSPPETVSPFRADVSTRRVRPSQSPSITDAHTVGNWDIPNPSQVHTPPPPE